jgi:hypothetical protein
MGFVDGYDRLNDAFTDGKTSCEAVLGDVFLPNDKTPDLTLAIGAKIEKSTGLTVPHHSGELAIAVTCRIIQLDKEKCDGVVPIEYFNMWNRQQTPEMYAKQIVEWSEPDNGFHQTRLFTSFSHDDLICGDGDWTQYEAALAEWQQQQAALTADDLANLDGLNEESNRKPIEPQFLSYRVERLLPEVHSDREYIDVTRQHYSLLFDVVDALPEGALAYSQKDCREYGSLPYIGQSPDQFVTHVDWLLS